MIDIVGVTCATVLVLLSAIHIYWAFGGKSGTAAVVPTVDGKPSMTPSTGATLVVALLLATAACLVVGAILGWDPRPLFRVGSAGVGVVLLFRAIGERGYIGFFKRVRDTPFARRDTFVYSPMCLLLAAGTLAVGTRFLRRHGSALSAETAAIFATSMGPSHCAVLGPRHRRRAGRR